MQRTRFFWDEERTSKIISAKYGDYLLRRNYKDKQNWLQQSMCQNYFLRSLCQKKHLMYHFIKNHFVKIPKVIKK